MKIFFKSSVVAFALFTLILACQRVPLTGRKQFVGLVSNEQMITMSFAEYKGFMDTSKVVSLKAKDAEMIARVGGRIKTAVENYLIQNNYSQVIDGYQWEFKLVESKELNAWCMPGGKVCFYTGILPICKDEAGIAVVMGHEIAHAIASHGRERMSQAMAAQGITQLGAIGAGVATGNQQVMEIAGQVLGVGSQLGFVLPNSRKQESEADKLGLIFMSMAGYNPQNAVDFWQRMAEAGSKSQKPPKLLSTHPADETRIADLKAQLPQAQKYYQVYSGNKK
ncbi:Beta-barrel assembly-enhancing protease [Emticicia aquatica]|uniref:Beta-barrel assembly-enhancing protease n=1 Tax=Emticicia aquatica TaxID=1681835 RepID=A0ABN8ET70_9BACT|nr:M48 family metallopeptidase [Emticicia aquatica]CAH0994893.1 Beta-barrel assembly-enhancing protease [Emticicia aquatica]